MNENAPVAPPGAGAPDERLGEHVSIRGGVALAPARGVTIRGQHRSGLTKNPNQWQDPEIARSMGRGFVEAYNRSGLNGLLAQDSYLIHLDHLTRC